jgi:replicative DNA helicase
MPKKAPPHDLDAEQAVLGAILIRNEAWGEIQDSLQAADFFRHVHSLIFAAMEKLHSAEEKIDFITLKRVLSRAGTMKEVGVAYLAHLVDGVPRTTNIKAYATIVVDLADRRRLQEVCRRGVVEVEAATTADEAATHLVEEARNAVQLHGEVGQTLRESIQDLINHLDHPVQATTTGLPTLDGMGAGFRPGELTLLAGRPSHGKTALALHLCKAASEAGLPCYFASLEMTKEALTMRWLASDAKVWFSALRGGTLTQTEFTQVSASVEHLSSLPITIDDHASIGLGDLRRVMLGSQGGLLIVDYLQLVQPPPGTRGQSRTQEVGAISRGLKAIAHDCRCSVLALSQLNRDVEHRGGSPRLSDLRDSGELEQDADAVWLLARPSLMDGEGNTPDDLAVLRVAKHRNGPLGRLELHFAAGHQTFRERQPGDAAPEESSDDNRMQGW